MKRFISVFLVMVMMFACAAPAFAVQAEPDKTAVSAAKEENGDNAFIAFFDRLFAKIRAFFNGIKYYFAVKKEDVPNTMNKNAIHMLKSVEDAIGDSFIITTEDGKVIVIDGGYNFETDYFIQYLKAVTGQFVPKIDVWFLTHPHADHVQVFNEVAENRTNQVKFDKVIHHYAPYEYYAAIDSSDAAEGAEMIAEFDRISKAFPEKVQIINEGDVFDIGAAKITVLYTFDPAYSIVNDSSLIFRMELGEKSILFTGDAAVNAGNKVLANPEYKELLDCDICKMSHHGQAGVSKEFYEAADPEICLWPTPSWVWNNSHESLVLQTPEVRAWIEEIGVEKNYLSWQGSQVIYPD